MQFREIGKSGIKASVVGIGTWAIGGWMWGGLEKNDVVSAIHAGRERTTRFLALRIGKRS